MCLARKCQLKIIIDWEPSIRPCEFNNFARIFNEAIDVQTGNAEYGEMMRILRDTGLNLVDFITSPPPIYNQLRNFMSKNSRRPKILLVLDKARSVVINNEPGCNMVRYLLLQMNNKIIKQQYSHESCGHLSNLNLKYGCIPFDTMPYSTSLVGHNPRISDLLECIPAEGREHEFFARLIRNNVENRGILYTRIDEIKGFDDIDDLIKRHNSRLYRKHGHREIDKHLGNVFIRGYEDDTLSIITKLLKLSSSGVGGYTESIESWFKETPREEIDDEGKKEALKKLFEKSKVALIYGAAGTGKSTMINHISRYFSDKSRLYLAKTNPAVDNLRRRVVADSNSIFRTIAKHNLSVDNTDYDILFVDECSTVSNSDMVKILNRTKFKLIVLVGDVYQIESIQFGNWFGAVRFFIPQSSVFELVTLFRTEKEELLDLWKKVRNIDGDIVEHITKNNHSQRLDGSVFHQVAEDEIILCLNYDGLYGINNANKFLQSSNSNPSEEWGVATYKVGDPVLFNELERFKPLIYNNLKGKIVGIVPGVDNIQFDVEIDKAITQLHAGGLDLKWIKTVDGKSTIRFVVYKNGGTDDDDHPLNTVVPFQVAYAVSIHKAQGLEYNSVKIIVAEAVDEAVTHSIFYTAITRAKENLKIYWTPEVGNKVISNLKHKINRRDAVLLSNKYSLSLGPPMKI